MLEIMRIKALYFLGTNTVSLYGRLHGDVLNSSVGMRVVYKT